MKQSIPQTINSNIDTKFATLELKYNTLQKSVDMQSQRIQQLERKIRKKNLIFFGVEESERNYFDLQQGILDILEQKMGLNCNETNIEEVRRLGMKDDGKKRPIVVTLNTLGVKINILKNKKKLDCTPYYIKEDFPPEILEERKKLSAQLLEERNNGRKAFLKYNKLIIIPEEQENQQLQKTKRNQNPNKRNLSESPENTSGYSGKNNTQKNPSKKQNSNIQQYMVKQPDQNKDLHSTSPHIDKTSTVLSQPRLNIKN
ncbi:Endonuclease-reverse transcriptase [Operophtera brumata]|uniref:Endonuclease-reverse transcriptase n=1 Tax=Operophtera brumata TaxID=104452 RepID=A0A0L7LIK1_OPEBR|nr:Endonuclease-reverse transcriptase [Operophtera brumata]